MCFWVALSLLQGKRGHTLMFNTTSSNLAGSPIPSSPSPLHCHFVCRGEAADSRPGTGSETDTRMPSVKEWCVHFMTTPNRRFAPIIPIRLASFSFIKVYFSTGLHHQELFIQRTNASLYKGTDCGLQVNGCCIGNRCRTVESDTLGQ